MPHERPAKRDQRPDMTEIDDLLQSKVRNLPASLIAIVEDEVRNRATVLSRRHSTLCLGVILAPLEIVGNGRHALTKRIRSFSASRDAREPSHPPLQRS